MVCEEFDEKVTLYIQEIPVKISNKIVPHLSKAATNLLKTNSLT